MKELTIVERTTAMERSVKMAKEIHEQAPVPGFNPGIIPPTAVLDTAKKIFDIITDNVPDGPKTDELKTLLTK